MIKKNTQCEICPQTFISKQKSQKYCSYTCAYEAIKQKSRAKYKAKKADQNKYLIITKNVTYLENNKMGINKKNLELIIKKAKDKNWKI